MDRQDKIDLFLIFSIVILIVVIIYAVTIYNRDSVECLIDPIDYYQALNNLSCKCQEYKPYLDIDDIDFSNMDLVPYNNSRDRYKV